MIMALNPQIVLPDSGVVTLNTLPAQVQQMGVNDAVVHVFNNFVEQIARVSPATMKEQPPIPMMQVRRSQRFKKPMEAQLSLPSTSEQPILEKPHRKRYSTFQILPKPYKLCRYRVLNVRGGVASACPDTSVLRYSLVGLLCAVMGPGGLGISSMQGISSLHCSQRRLRVTSPDGGFGTRFRHICIRPFSHSARV